MLPHRILWLKWKDPLAHLVHEDVEDDDDELEAEAARCSFLSDDEPHYSPGRPREVSLGAGIVGPFGVVPLHEDNVPGKLFNFWVGHTNFDLTPEVVNRIQAAPGVETLDVFTRYRFRLGIGKAFKQDEVKQEVERVAITAPGGKPDLGVVKLALRNRYKHWAIYIMPDGRFEVAGGTTVDEVEQMGSRHAATAQEVVRSW